MNNTLLERLGKELLFFDGGMGTEIQKTGYKTGHVPEEINIEAGEIIIDIHERYLKAGADFITTNTFGCNPYKIKGSKYSLKELLDAALKNACIARERSGRSGVYIALDLGPIGQLIEPLGPLTFNNVYDAYSEVINLAKDKVDLILLETMTSLYELKAGILAAKENCDLPIFTSMTFDESGRTLTGSNAEIYAAFAEGMGVSAIGVNCSTGPDKLAPVVEPLLKTTALPLFMQPNAGLPKLKGLETVFDLTPELFLEGVKPIMEKGVAIIGGCCGTSPAFIKLLKEELPSSITPRRVEPRTIVTSCTEAVTIDRNVTVCGERLNPTGKKKLREAIQAGNFDVLVSEALAQEEAGAKVLDVNLGVPGVDEAACMLKVIPMLQAATTLPLQIDSSVPEALEAACRIYNGKPLINSVNGKEESLTAILPIVKKYGGVLIGLTLEHDIPAKAEERVAIADKIISRAASYGIEPKNLVIDCLTLTASAQQAEVYETLKAVKIMTERGFNTALGVSNVSFGLPNRPLLNKTFFTMALQAGLSLPIINPLDADMMGAVDAYRVLLNLDINSEKYIEKHVNDVVAAPGAKAQTQTASGTATGPGTSPEDGIKYYILKGLSAETVESTRKALENTAPLDLINDTIIPALSEVGSAYEKGKLFLPQLMQASEAAKAAFAEVQKHFTVSSEKKGPVIIATVEGDVHDIGKNIVKVVLESYGYDVRDLGKDVKIENLIVAAKEIQPKAIGLSALMTTTVLSMKKSIIALHEAGINVPIFVGGAVLTEQIAKDIGADYYTVDAMADVRLLEKIIE